VVYGTNLAIVREVWAAANRGDFAAAAAFLDSDAVYEDRVRPDDAQTYRGASEVAAAWRDWIEPWDDPGASLERVTALDDENVVSVHRARVPGPGGDLTDQRYARLWRLREGRIAQVMACASEEAALNEAQRA
jgi:ketosteroid isomerase-like protein